MRLHQPSVKNKNRSQQQNNRDTVMFRQKRSPPYSGFGQNTETPEYTLQPHPKRQASGFRQLWSGLFARSTAELKRRGRGPPPLSSTPVCPASSSIVELYCLADNNPEDSCTVSKNASPVHALHLARHGTSQNAPLRRSCFQRDSVVATTSCDHPSIPRCGCAVRSSPCSVQPRCCAKRIYCDNASGSVNPGVHRYLNKVTLGVKAVIVCHEDRVEFPWRRQRCALRIDDNDKYKNVNNKQTYTSTRRRRSILRPMLRNLVTCFSPW